MAPPTKKRRAGIRHLTFELGDERVWYRDLPDVERLIYQLGMPDEEDLWQWGFCRRSSGDYVKHVARGFSDVIAAIEADSIAIEAILGCAPFQNSSEQFVSTLEAEVLPKIPGGNDDFTLIEGRECVNVLQAVKDAKEMIHAGCENVLILATEKVEKETRRFRKYSLFSDFSLTLIVSAQVERCAYEVRDVLIRADPAPGADTSSILTRDLESDCVAALLESNGMTIRDVARFFYLNLHQPIAEMKVKEVGFEASQMYTLLAREIAHCYGGDPFINLDSYSSSGGEGTTHLLCASSRSYAGASIVERLSGEEC